MLPGFEVLFGRDIVRNWIGVVKCFLNIFSVERQLMECFREAHLTGSRERLWLLWMHAAFVMC